MAEKKKLQAERTLIFPPIMCHRKQSTLFSSNAFIPGTWNKEKDYVIFSLITGVSVQDDSTLDSDVQCLKLIIIVL